jgi:hypothetical protein
MITGGARTRYLRSSRQPSGLESAVPAGALIGYARVSTSGQLLDREQHALAEVGCRHRFRGAAQRVRSARAV